MAPSIPEKNRILQALETQWNDLVDLCSGLSEEEWGLPTECPGWDVKDNLSHIVGTELLLSGEPIPEIEIPDAGHLKNEIAKINEKWVMQRRDKSGPEVLEEFKQISAKRLDTLKGLSEEEWAAESPTPIGLAPYGRFMGIRVLDSWFHEQDIRHAINRMGHDDDYLPIEITLDEVSLALGFVVGKLAKAPDNTRVEFDLSGKSGRKILIEVIDGRAQQVDSLGGAAHIKIRTSVGSFGRLVGGRKVWRDVMGANDLDIETDSEHAQVGRDILDNLGYMI